MNYEVPGEHLGEPETQDVPVAASILPIISAFYIIFR